MEAKAGFTETMWVPSQGFPIYKRVHVLIIMFLATLATAAQANPTHQTLERSRGVEGTAKPEHRHHRHRHHNKSTDKLCPLGIGGHAGDIPHCCKNGGVPIMGRCACPRNFDGDYCELRKRGCMEIPHGGVFKQDCSLCTCQYGIVSCITRAFSNCAFNDFDGEDDGSMKTYDLRSKKQKEAALSRLPSLLVPTSSSGQPANHLSTHTLAVTLILSLTFLLAHGL